MSVGVVSSTNLQAYENKNSAWDVFYTLPGWVTTFGNGIELQKNVVTQSQNGSQHVELDSHINGQSNSVMTQSLSSLTIGADYLLAFYYKPRTDNINDNGINVFWYEAATDFDLNMQTSFISKSTKSTTPNWILQSVILTAKSTSMDLSFGAFGKQNTLGGLIDNVSLVQVNNTEVTTVPEPSVLLLFLLGFCFLVRRHGKMAM